MDDEGKEDVEPILGMAARTRLTLSCHKIGSHLREAADASLYDG